MPREDAGEWVRTGWLFSKHQADCALSFSTRRTPRFHVGFWKPLFTAIMTDLGSLADCRVLGNELRIAAVRGLSRAVSAAASDSVVPFYQNECLVLLRVAMLLSGSRTGPHMTSDGRKAYRAPTSLVGTKLAGRESRQPSAFP